jgi:DNA-binding transcriptional LysR family regulator
MDVELRHLRALVAVVDAGSFTHGAATLGVSQAAASRAVADLERILARRLLHRSTRHLTPTTAGTSVLAIARRILDAVSDLEQQANQSPSVIRLGYAWAALGKHTVRLQRRWASDHPTTRLVLVHSNTPSAGLAEGAADVAVLRRPLQGRRFEVAPVGVEARYAAMATGSSLARRRRLRLADIARFPVALDERTGTTTTHLWASVDAPTKTRVTHGLEDWLTLIAAGQAVGITSEATANQNPRPGIAYRAVVDAEPINVSLAWWRTDPPPLLQQLLALTRDIYAGVSPASR